MQEEDDDIEGRSVGAGERGSREGGRAGRRPGGVRRNYGHSQGWIADKSQ